MNARLRGIYGIVDAGMSDDALGVLDAMLAGGIRIVQYRAKGGVDRNVVRALHERTQAARAWLIVNDDLEAALEADGWHAGQEDLAGYDVVALRAKLGTRLFGVSCDDGALARVAQTFGADYVGVGPFNVTSTKRDAGAPIGVAGVSAVVAATDLPVVAIGGIDTANLEAVASSGAAMAAVVSAIALAADPRLAARELVRLWSEYAPG